MASSLQATSYEVICLTVGKVYFKFWVLLFTNITHGRRSAHNIPIKIYLYSGLSLQVTLVRCTHGVIHHTSGLILIIQGPVQESS